MNSEDIKALASYALVLVVLLIVLAVIAAPIILGSD